MPTCCKAQWVLIGTTRIPRAPQPHHHHHDPTPRNPTTDESSRLVSSTQRGTF
jgi:hypothetical protein